MHTGNITSSARHRPSADMPIPPDVADVLLWRLAADVMIEHQPGPDGHCANLRCADEQGPCTAAIQAQHALRAARRRTVSATATPRPPTPDPATARRPPERPQRGAAVGRAPVRTHNTGRFTGWFTSTANAITRWRPDQRLPQRTPGLAIRTA